MAISQLTGLLFMAFHERLSILRKQKGLTQQALADKASIHVAQIRRYEANDSQPTLDVIRKLAIALTVSADSLVFEEDERGPDEDLRLQFEAVSHMDPNEKNVIKTIIESMIIKHDAQRWMSKFKSD